MNHSPMHYFMNPRHWWIFLALIAAFSGAGLIYTGRATYTDAPPVADFTDTSGRMVITRDTIIAGQKIFQQYALMEYGSMFGDGAGRGPDYTADALHYLALAMKEFYLIRDQSQSTAETRESAALARVSAELKRNNYNAQENRIQISEARSYAFSRLEQRYQSFFDGSDSKEGFKPSGYIRDPAAIRNLSAFFFWGAWVCATARPGETASYTHNWPFDPEAGNTAPPAVLMWSMIGLLALALTLGLCLYFYGHFDRLNTELAIADRPNLLGAAEATNFNASALQRSTYKIFAAAMLLFLLQVLAGVMTIHDFVGLVQFGSYNISQDLPVTVTRSWHVQLSLLWIAACWTGVSIFILPIIQPQQPRGQKVLSNILFTMLAAIAAGAIAGLYAGPKGLLGHWWNLLGHQGWEFVEMGRAWQALLWVALALWCVIIFRGVKGVLVRKNIWALPNWLLYSVVAVTLLLLSGFMIRPEGNFVVSDFWRWCVIHMWAEAFFEVFTTIVAGYLMVIMGLVSSAAVVRVVYLATLLFLGSGLLGIAHNFYWNAKPVGTLALGSVFSTLQVIPLILLTIEAWRFRNLTRSAGGKDATLRGFGLPVTFLFLIAVNFWNFLGAGVFGLIINLPIVNYYEHGTYLTVNHGHAALMGVYGNLSLAAVFFCMSLLGDRRRWNGRTARTIFWSVNAGLLLMVLLDTLPAGILQLQTVMEKGFWFARSQAFVKDNPFQALTWARIVGGAIFLWGGLLPLVYLVLRSRHAAQKPPADATAKYG